MHLSVIVPTRNRVEVLQGTIESLLRASRLGCSVEFIVVDNGSTDGTLDFLTDLSSTRGHPVRFVEEPIPGLLSGRHRGIKEADGDVLVFVDDDVVVDEGWLGAIAQAFANADVQLVGGRSLPRYLATPPVWVQDLWVSTEDGEWCDSLSLIDLGSEPRFIDPNLVWGLNLSIRKRTLVELGGFHPDNIPKNLQRFQGDGETGLTRAAAARGLKAWYEPRALLEHVIPEQRLSASSFASRFFYQGVCDSYAWIRAHGRTSRGKMLNSALRELAASTSGHWSVDVRSWNFRQRFHRAYWQGFRFHHREVDGDPSLLEWVLRPDYWNYELPGHAVGTSGG